MKEIPLTRGKVALVDDDDFKLIGKHKWYAQRSSYSNDAYYARRVFKENGVEKHVFLHGVLLSSPQGMEIDHINGNSLDNRRCNLRIATHSQNQANQKIRKTGTSKYKGVHWHTRDKKWRAKIKVNSKAIHLGDFTDEVKAAKTYDINAVLLFGEFARLNFPVGGKK